MSHRAQLTQHKPVENLFRLKPLVACMRVIIAGGLFAGSGVSAANPHSPLPEATLTPITAGQAPVSIIDQAKYGQATAAIAGNAMTVHQITDKATIDWNSFNISKGYSVNFQQNSTSSVALNNIHQADASVILGTLTANGQIYLVNQNGFVFGNGSVVDANTLVASALNISDEALKKGIIRVYDNNPNPSTTNSAALDGVTNDSATAVNPTARITVEKGAKIHAGQNGSVILAAPTVDNSGSISADQQGQIILVASQDKVYLQPTSSKDPFAGLLVEVGKGGTVNNNADGNVAVRQGNITLAGFAVNQNGRLSATTSVNVNGSIRLLAREAAVDSFDPKANTHNLTASQTVRNGGATEADKSHVIFGKDSAVTVLADANGGSAIDEQAQKQSLVEVSADKIDMQSGSSIVATGGQVNFIASNNPIDTPNNPLTGVGGRIDLESGSKIDVSGTKNVQVAMARNVASVSVQSFNLRDAPYQRGGVLQGKTVQVDIRNLPTILDASGAPQAIMHGIDERLGNGGTINLTSAGDVVVNTGAVTNISGGSVDYQSGFINTTKLVTTTGQVVDIGAANPNVQYASIFGVVTENHAKWGVIDTWNLMGQLSSGRFEKGYTEGKAGGALNIQSPVTAWSGQLIAGAVTGINQRNNPVSGGSLSFNQGDNGGTTTPTTGPFFSSQNVSFQTAAQLLNIGIDKPVYSGDLVLSSALVNQSGISNLTVKTSGNVTVAKDTALSMPALSNFQVDASNINIMGSIYTAGGTIALKSVNTDASNSGQLNVAATAILDVSGRWINDFQNGLTSSIVINAGSVSLNANNELNFNHGAEIKADGGAWLSSNGTKLTAGKAGSINLVAGTSTITGQLHVDGEMSAFGLNQGGSLSLTTNKINIGGQVAEINALNLGVTNGGLDVAATAGFNSISLTSNDQNITVKANTDLSLISQNRVLTANYRNQAGSKSIAGFSQVVTLPENLRKPVTLSLTGQTGVTLETGSQIHVDKASTVNLTAENAGKGIYVDGLIDAAAGKINLNLKADVTSLAYDGSQSIWLGSNANLNVKGTTLLNPIDALGRVSGSVLKGGDVTFKADRGYVVVEKGAKIDVSGTSASFALPVANSKGLGLQYKSQVIGSDAGKIKIAAAEGIVLDGTINAKAGSATNLGGSLNLTLDRNQRKEQSGDSSFPVNALQFNVVQDTQVTLPDNAQFGSIPDSMNGQATISSKQIAQAGIDQLSLAVPVQRDSNDGSLRLPGVVNFVGDVKLDTASSIVLDTQVIKWSGVNGALTGAVNLDTAFLQLGSSTYNNIIGASASGGGKLTTNAMWTQLEGAALMTGFSDINLNSVHDLRAIGVLDPTTNRSYSGNLSTAANLNLNASQIYPTTLTSYTFAVTDALKQLTITGSNTDASPLSAAGQLIFNASTINQNGVLKAPLGTIELNATTAINFGKGSMTSVSADGLTIPFGVLVNNVWEYPLDGINNLVFNKSLLNSDTNLYEYLTVGEKHLVFQSPTIKFNTGSIVDVSGGGNLLASQFQPGLGGSTDYLLSGSGGFAILPSLGSSLAPFDPNISANFAYDPRTTVYLNGTSTLAAGFYTVLPSQYALLPGAFLVTQQANTQDQVATSYTTTGLPIVSGYLALAGTDTRSSRLSGFLIESSADVQKHSQYNIQNANDFFKQQAATNNTSVPLLPIDSGQISINASIELLLNGQFKVASPNGRGAKMDISSQNIEVVNFDPSTAAIKSGTLQIWDQNLSQLHVDSLLLGGERQTDVVTGNTNLTVTANNVTFDAGTKVQALDLVAAAKSKVEVMSKATIASSGTVNTGDSVFNISGDSALLRVSADKQITVNHLTPGSTGSLVIDQGAVLSATKSMLLDASSTELSGDIVMHGGSLSLAANAINIGDISGLTGASLNLTNQQLINLSVDELVLNSRSSVNFYGDVGQVDNKGNLTPIIFNNLVVNAAGFSGFGSNAQAAKLQANNLFLANPSGAVATTPGSGQGSLDLTAKNFTQGAGSFGVNGFNNVNLTVDNGFVADGKSKMTVAGDLNLSAGYLTTTGGSSLTLDASGHALTVTGNGSSYNPAMPVFGGAMTFIANKVDFDANALLSSGTLNLHSLTGDVTVGSHANINLAGKAVAFADVLAYTSGGTFSAVADSGSITLATGSQLDISTGGGAAAGGKLDLKAASLNQSVTMLGQLAAKGSSALLDVSKFSDASSFDSLMAVLKNAGISDSLYVRSRDADISVGDVIANKVSVPVISAKDITLVADKGAIDILGWLNANGVAQGGNINLFAGGKVSLESGSQLTATGVNGGNVLLSSIDANAINRGNVLLSASDSIAINSGIDLKAGSVIDVSGSSGIGGNVTLNALRTSSDGVNVDGINIKTVQDAGNGNQMVAGTVKGANHFYAQGVQIYNNTDITSSDVNGVQNGLIDSNLVNKINNDTINYINTASSKVANMGGGIVLRPGNELDYNGKLSFATGNLTPDLSTSPSTAGGSLAPGWDLSNLSQSQTPIIGTLTIRASDSLNINNSLTDGFVINPDGTQGKLHNGGSWSFQLVSGADLTSADTLSNVAAKDMTIGTGVSVHTGSGDIKLASGGNLVFTDQTSTIYNAGRADSTSPTGALAANKRPIGDYPIAGGELHIRADGNIEGAVSNQFLTGWLNTQGTVSTGRRTSLTAWAVNASQFQQNIGSFGGGKVDIAASGNINDLSVMMPTTGKQMGTTTATNNVQIQGGGQMLVSAGGDISGGAFYLGKGNGAITAGGQIMGSTSTAATAFTAGPQLVMSGDQSDPISGNTNLTLNAGSGIHIGAVSDGMLLGAVASSANTQFFSYTNKSLLALKSLAGNINLNADTSKINGMLGITNPNEQQLTTVYPASLDVTAFGGSVKLDHDVILFPSAKSNLNVLAKQSITSSSDQFSFIMSDANPDLLPNLYTTINYTGNANQTLTDVANTFNTQAINLGGNNVSPLIHANTPIHSKDNVPVRFVTQVGDISSVQIIMPKQTIIQAGRDLINTPIQIQQINQTDASIISALRDIAFVADLNRNGNPTDKNDSYQISISGPGNTLVKTGRNLDLGASVGLTTVGNLYNAALPSGGASLDVLVGLNAGTPSYSAFINKYLQTNSLYEKQLTLVEAVITPFMEQRTGKTLSDADALKEFGKLTGDQTLSIQPQLNAILTGVFFNELKIAGSASAANKSVGNKGGFTAIDTLFPGNQWQGDLTVFYSKLQTVNGGDINLMVPGGQVNAGLAVAPSGVGAKTSDKLGIVAQAQGDINAFVKKDFIVNTSRVFTLGGGDILIWSSEGNIDAGKGAKSALAVTIDAPYYDANNQLVIPAPKITSGSGIRTAASPGVPAGNVFLFAPQGVVNAGEAGIGGSNVTISATAVLGANNIQVSGTSTGVPVASVGSVAAGLTGTSNVTANAGQVAQAAMGAEEKDKVDNKNMALGMLSVELLGFGE